MAECGPADREGAGKPGKWGGAPKRLSPADCCCAWRPAALRAGSSARWRGRKPAAGCGVPPPKPPPLLWEGETPPAADPGRDWGPLRCQGEPATRGLLLSRVTLRARKSS